ncbi:MAG: Asp-tRNA(Asn)/Glu-tRNA(Gln) amidotransferase subunit GatA [SAR202 cluster bacterium]|nr:Asp-tRNA(Asn)/Glu-tRNA(Gln) amidotransferase subunit GatA [SAR202 cluster bacterium]
MPANNTDLCYLTIAEAAPLLRDRQLSPVELTRAYLERIQALDSRLHAYVTLLPEQALAQARSAEAEILRGHYRGPLHGVPIGLKDLYDTKGIRTTAMSRVTPDRIPQEDAACTVRLREAGTILLGKLAMHEFALGGPDPTSLFPPARNPWDLARIPGGSSSGSGAAVAAGLCMGSLGSDTGGSIRGPASLCSIVGLKPTYGRVSAYGVVPLSWSQDHCGPMTWTVTDTALMLQAIAGPDPKDPTTAAAPVPDYSQALQAGIRGMTIGVPRQYFYESGPDVEPQTLAAIETALDLMRELGAEVRDVEIPHIEYARAANQAIMMGEAFAFHEHNLQTRRQDYGDMVRVRFLLGGLISSSDYLQAQRVRRLIKREMAQALQEVDVLVTPTSPKPAALLEGYDATVTLTGRSFTSPFNVAGLPAISIPGGFTREGLPIGLQIAGKPFDEPTVLRVACGYEQAARWFERRPPV